MITLEIWRSNKENHWKIISRSSNRHQILVYIASVMKTLNITSLIKIGVYSCPQMPFSPYQTVYSYIADSSQRMTQKQYYDFLRGKYTFGQNKKRVKKGNTWEATEIPSEPVEPVDLFDTLYPEMTMEEALKRDAEEGRGHLDGKYTQGCENIDPLDSIDVVDVLDLEQEKEQEKD